MTARQITKKLTDAGIDTRYLTIDRDEVAVYVTDADGDRDWDATDALMRRVAAVLKFGGYRCASGEWILQRNYVDKGDWMDKTSRWHY
jgi:signal-transduction protein with cAMP-binding, CBS, and nucleotidyltransferase domain